jgi:hypothetical protein
MLLADLHLARRLEAAEGHAAAQFALARKRLDAGLRLRGLGART